MDIPAKLLSLGYVLPTTAKAIAAYVPAAGSGNLLFVSGQLPWKGGALLATGKVPSQVTLELAQRCAGECIVQALGILSAELDGDFARLKRVVRIGVFVQSDDTFTEQARVANGASELLQQLFGDIGRHSRASVGVNALPMNACVEVEAIFEIGV